MVPSILILTCNILICRELAKNKSKSRFLKNQQTAERVRRDNRRMALTQITLSFLFLAVTLPRSVAILVYISLRTEVSLSIVKVSDLVVIFYLNSNIFLLLAKNKPFRAQFIDLFASNDDRRRRSSSFPSYQLNTTTNHTKSTQT